MSVSLSLLYHACYEPLRALPQLATVGYEYAYRFVKNSIGISFANLILYPSK